MLWLFYAINEAGRATAPSEIILDLTGLFCLVIVVIYCYLGRRRYSRRAQRAFEEIDY